MAEEKKMSDYVTRDMYRQIKAMNRERMCEFLYNLYKEIYADYESKIQRECKAQPDYEKIRSEILKIRGIGDVKADQIVEIVKECSEVNCNED